MTRVGLDPSFRQRVRARTPLLGTFLNLGSPLAAEACAIAGYDWLLVDLEHGGRGEEAMLGQLLAGAAHGVPVLVRVETPDRIRAGRVLDAGAAGVMFPRIDTAEGVAEAVRHLQYPPQGDRGVATYNRSCGFGLVPGSLDTSGERIVSVIQVESEAAVRAVDAIAAIPGVDVLFVGPRDLSHDLGVPGAFGDPTFQAALDRVSGAAAAAGIAAGILAGSAEAALRYVDAGFTFVAVGSDSTSLATSARDVVSAFASRPAIAAT